MYYSALMSSLDWFVFHERPPSRRLALAICLTAIAWSAGSLTAAARDLTSIRGSGGRTLAPVGTNANGDWSMFHNGFTRQGVNSSETDLSPATVPNLTLKWSYMTGASVWSSPAVADGIVYIGSDDRSVYALDADTGAVVWSKQTRGKVRSPPAVVKGVVYVGSEDHKVYALNATSGQTVWRTALNGEIELSSPLVANDMVYVGSLDGHLYALDQATGAIVWKTKLWAVRGSAAFAGDTIYVGSYKSKVFALNADTGATVWTYATGARVRNTPTLSGGLVYVGADDYKLYALSASSGKLKWETDPLPGLGIVRSTPAVWNGMVYVDTGETSPMDSHLYVFDADTGVQVCNHEMADYATSSVAVANGVAYVGSFSHQLYAFDATDCTKLWDSGFTLMQGGVPSSPAVSHGVVYVGSMDGGLYSFHLAEGPPVGTYVNIGDSAFDPEDAIGHKIGNAVQWTNTGVLEHTVTESSGMGFFDSGIIEPGGTYSFAFLGAGIYHYACTVDPAMTGSIKAPMILSPTSGTISTVFTIQWATAPPPAGFVYDVQIQRPGSADWTNWEVGVTTTQDSFVPDSGTGTYSFRAHVEQIATGFAATYSVLKSIVVS
jgi:outer membrane protein assembly factor BamB